MAFALPTGISNAAKTLNSTYEALKTFMEIRDEVKRQNAVLELQQKILSAQKENLSAQQEYTALVNTISELEARIAGMEAWNTEKEKYELYEAASGCFAFRQKETMQSSEPTHALCPDCFADRKKSFLQKKHYTTGRVQTLSCHRCGLEIVTQGVIDPTAIPSLAKGRR